MFLSGVLQCVVEKIDWWSVLSFVVAFDCVLSAVLSGFASIELKLWRHAKQESN